MAHEIEQHDKLVLHKEVAWHGLGVVIPGEAPTPEDARKLVFDWEPVCYPLAAIKDVTVGDSDDKKVTRQALAVASHKAIYRNDVDVQLGVVGKDYQPVLNKELADFCTALAEGGDVVRCESAGSIRNGQKVWMLLKGETFTPGIKKLGSDEIVPYLCVSNGHDGGAAFRATPTTVRVVCSNTLHMVIPQESEGALRLSSAPAGFACNHTKSVMERVEEAKRALQLYGRALDGTKQVINALAAKDVNQEMIQQFFLQCYTVDFGDIPVNPKDKKEKDAAYRAKVACNAVMQRFDAERKLAGANLWNTVNAYTGWLQNDSVAVVTTNKGAEQRLNSKLFGTNAQRAHHALKVALSLAS